VRSPARTAGRLASRGDLSSAAAQRRPGAVAKHDLARPGGLLGSKTLERLSQPIAQGAAQSAEDAMRRTVLQVIKTMHGSPTDQLTDLDARIQAERTNAAGAIGDLEELAQARRVADDYDAARALDEKIARAQWAIERAE